jgi:hypothetical protein
MLQFSEGVRNAMLDAIEVTVGASPRLQLRSGPPPANCAAASVGTLLCEITLPSDWMSAASSGTKTKLGTWSGVGATGGTVGHYRIVNAAGTVCHEQGSVTIAGGGGDMTVDNPSIAASQNVTVNTKSLTAPNG